MIIEKPNKKSVNVFGPNSKKVIHSLKKAWIIELHTNQKNKIILGFYDFRLGHQKIEFLASSFFNLHMHHPIDLFLIASRSTNLPSAPHILRHKTFDHESGIQREELTSFIIGNPSNNFVWARHIENLRNNEDELHWDEIYEFRF